jgi:hypothetical protein
VMAWHIGRSDVGHAQSSIWGKKILHWRAFCAVSGQSSLPRGRPARLPFLLVPPWARPFAAVWAPRETCLPDFRVAIPEHRWILGDNRSELEVSCSQG